MSRKQFLRWEKRRLKGKSYVVLTTAVVSGIFFFVLLNLASWAWSGLPLSKVFVLAYPALGLLTGTIIWWINEERFAGFLLDKETGAAVRR
ncbi:MAG: hypothetical protein IPL32_01185 [Chloracidobacterium sp.]|nr:hypothetical protein [Chloracidobacterium sp.]